MTFEELTKQANDDPALFESRLKQTLERIERENLIYNSFLRTYLSAANLSRIFEKLTATKRGKPFFGLTFAVKDNIRVQHQPLTLGLQPPVEERAFEHAEIVRRLIELGATLIGSTNLDPMCIDYVGDNPFFGKVQNPRFRERIPAGSSSGSAAAVSAGHVDFALGTDYGGSVRAPAAACAVSGFKFTQDAVSRRGVVYLSEEMDALGLFAKRLSDQEFLASVLLKEPAAVDANVQILIPCRAELDGISAPFNSQFQRCLEALQTAMTLRELDVELGFSAAIECRKIIAACDFELAVHELKIERETLPGAAHALLAFARTLSVAQKEQAYRKRQELCDHCSALLEGGTYVLTPALPEPPPAWSALQLGRHPAPLHRFLALANVAGLPALSFPLGQNQGHFPLSLHIFGRALCDRRLLGISQAVERLLMQKVPEFYTNFS